VGNHPWAVPRAVVADMSGAIEQLGYPPVTNYAEALVDTLTWARDACRHRDWRAVFPWLASYASDPFDYVAEDAYVASA
jgi:hypothetical protein